jgi:hypothetical protein
MNRPRSRISRLALVAVLLVSVASACTEEVPEPTKREQAFELLRTNFYIDARPLFEELLAESPNDGELRYGAALAALGESIDHVNYLTTLAFGILGTNYVDDSVENEKAEALSADENDFPIMLFARTFEFLADPLERAVGHLEQIPEGTTLAMEDFQIRFWQNDFFELSGTWDSADAKFLLTGIAPLYSLLHILKAHDLSLDFYGALHYVFHPELEFPAPKIGNILTRVLASESHPDFLKLRGDAGTAQMKEVSRVLAAASTGFVDAVELAGKRSAGVGILDLTENDDGERALRLTKRVRMVNDDLFDLYLQVIPGGYWGTVEVDVPDETLEAFAKIGAHFENGGQHLVVNDILYAVVPSALGLIAHFDFSETVRKLLESFSDIDLIVTIVDDVLPDGLELSPYAWMQSGKGVRQFFPAYRTDLPGEQQNFLLEWECPYFAQSVSAEVGSSAAYPNEGFLCPEEGDVSGAPDAAYEPVDAYHFYDPAFTAASIEPIERDGIASALPVIAFADPTFAGMLFLDPSEVVDASPMPAAGVVPADNRSLNAWIAQLFDQFISFLQ